ncbi:MAG: hypothetical protein K9H64_23655 [Bacteroidales bacterium]|nr:hypothetical protein [Bacteroidales bacterium]MCF8459037.1 hypothetical protein [Bacteroidales bacterium]
MIGIKNYFQEVKAIDFNKLPDSFQSFHSTMDLLAEDYDNDKEIREAINAYLKALNAELAKSIKAEEKKHTPKQKSERKKPVPAKEKTTPKAKTATKTKAAPKAAKKTTSRQPEAKAPKMVGHIDPIVAIAKRFLSCEGKVRTVAYMLRLLAHVEKQVISETITKRAAHYNMVRTIEKELQTIIRATIDAGRDEVLITTFSDEKRAKYQAVAKSEKVRPSVNVIKRFTGIAGKKDKQESAERLLKTTQNLIKKNPKDKHVSKLRKIKTSLTQYVGGQKPIPVDEISLAGISADQLKDMKFNELGLTGKWKGVLGHVTVPFSLMTYGRPGSGKSTLGVAFAAYLAKELGKKVLFVASEEGIGATLQDKFRRMNAFHPNIRIEVGMPENIGDYDVAFVD